MPRVSFLADPDPAHALLEHRAVIFDPSSDKLANHLSEPIPTLTPFFSYELLLPGNVIHGPAVVVRSDTSVLIGIYDEAYVDPFSNLWIQIGEGPFR